jgi:hypothetical protein
MMIKARIEIFEAALGYMIDPEKLGTVLEDLPPRERLALKLRFGLPPISDRHKLAAIGVLVGNHSNPEIPITGARASELIKKALRRLRHPSKSDRLKFKPEAERRETPQRDPGGDDAVQPRPFVGCAICQGNPVMVFAHRLRGVVCGMIYLCEKHEKEYAGGRFKMYRRGE